jgi:pyruvate dehydrogenase E1 component alpha subunit
MSAASAVAAPVAAPAGSLARFSRAQLHDALARMHLIRKFEEGAEQAYMRGLVHGTMHLSIGQEATAVGVCAVLRPDDYITSTHRGHGHCIGKGADPKFMFAEFFGKDAGYCRGRGGSMHIADIASGNLGANGIVGGGLPIAVGAALALRQTKRDQVVVCFFGDGANNEGAFHESLNMAAIWSLPVVFVCENNQYGMSMSTERSTAVQKIAQRAQAYDIPGVTTDGNDFGAVAHAAAEAVDRARAGAGPSLLECVTYRHRGHSKSDRNRYRTKEEMEAWVARDPIGRFEHELLSQRLIDHAEIDAIAGGADREIAAAIDFAKECPSPDPSTLTDFVYFSRPGAANRGA